MQHDLNDLYYFAMVVDHGGFAAAERALGIPKSRLSRRISQLETDLGVRLLQRSTRRFAVTDVGMSVHRHAQTMLAEKKITQGTARLLLSAQKLGGEGIVNEALKEIQSNDGSQTPDEIIEHFTKLGAIIARTASRLVSNR